MKITRSLNEYNRVFNVDPFDGEYTTITVNQVKASGEWQPATINWPAIGSVTVNKAREFTNGLNLASAIADNLNHGIIPEPTKA